MKRLSGAIIILFCCANLHAAPLDVHDARTDGKKNSPVNGQWSYRTAEWNAGGNSGDIMTWYDADQWGFGEHYGIGEPGMNLRPIFDVDTDDLHPNFYNVHGVNDPNNEQVGGHGDYMISWTADADTTSQVEVSGYVYNSESPRPTWWKIKKNNALIADGYTASQGTTGGGDFVNLWGYENRRTFAESLNSGSLLIDVVPGDRIDIIVPPSEHPDHPLGPPMTVFMKYTITEGVPEPTTMGLLGLALGSLVTLRRRWS